MARPSKIEYFRKAVVKNKRDLIGHIISFQDFGLYLGVDPKTVAKWSYKLGGQTLDGITINVKTGRRFNRKAPIVKPIPKDDRILGVELSESILSRIPKITTLPLLPGMQKDPLEPELATRAKWPVHHTAAAIEKAERRLVEAARRL